MERRNPTKTSGEWLILAAAVLWGTTGTALAFAPPGTSPVGVGAVRLAIGGLASIGCGGRARPPAQPGALAGGQSPCWRRSAWRVTSCASLPAVAATGVAVGTVVAIGSAPVLAGALGWLLNREKPGRRWGLATALAILGCALLVLPGGQLTLQAWGISLALGAGLCYASVCLAGQTAVGRTRAGGGDGGGLLPGSGLALAGLVPGGYALAADNGAGWRSSCIWGWSPLHCPIHCTPAG